MLKNSYFRVALFTLMLVGAIAAAGGIKTWVNGDTLTVTDLNANFAHIHNSMVGGHGARLVNADVSTSANITYTKIENGRGIARAWAEVSATCACPGTCTVTESLNVTSITCAATGVYTVTFSYTATDADFLVIANTAGTSGNKCEGVSTSTTTATINCLDLDTPAATDSTFGFIVMDGD